MGPSVEFVSRINALIRETYSIIYYPFNFQACHKSEYCPGPSVTGPSRKRCLNTDLGYVPWAMRVWPPI